MMIIVGGLIFGVIVITSVLLLSSFMIPINDAFAATITAVKTQSEGNNLEHDPFLGVQGGYNSLVHVDADTYALAYSGANHDGFISTFTISADGIVSWVATLEHDDNAYNLHNSLVHVDADIYALAYEGSDNLGFITTFTISADGSTITELATLLHDAVRGQHNSLVQVDTDTYALAYSGSGGAGFISTFTISADGRTITAVKTQGEGNNLKHDRFLGRYNSLVQVDTDTYALAYSGLHEDGFISTFTISADGVITAVKTQSEGNNLEHDTVRGEYNSLVHVDADTYALAYHGSGEAGFISTFTISADGVITAVKTLFPNANNLEHHGIQYNGKYNSLVQVDTDTYALAYSGPGSAGSISTFTIDSDGVITAVKTWSEGNNLKHDTVQGYYNSLVQVDADTYALAYTGANNDGFISTFTISSSSTSAPSKVGTVTPTSGNTQVALSWVAPATGGSAITDYIIQYSTDNSSWTTFSDGTSTGTTATVTGLTNNQQYYFKVAAVNGVGTGTYSNSVTSTPAISAPSQVIISTTTESGSTASLSWVAPATGGSAITDYIIQYSTDNSSWTTFSDGTSTDTSVTITGLSECNDYYYRVSAVNGIGTGTTSSNSQNTPDVSAGYDYEGRGVQDFTTKKQFGSSVKFESAQIFGAVQEFGASQIFGEGNAFANSQNFCGVHNFVANAIEFGTTTTFDTAQTFGDAAKFAANQDFTNVNHDFTATAIFFDSGGVFSASEVMGVGADFSSGTQNFGNAMTFGEATEFGDLQDWSTQTYTFEKYMHFGDTNDFAEKIQTFKEGTSFGEGTIFKDNQSIPINTIPSFGMLLQAITCGSDTSSETCMPNDATKYLSPGEFLTVGQDPASTSISISKNNKNFSVDGIGLEMTFAEIETNGTIESDLYDPANIPSSTLVGSTGKVSVSTSNVGTVETIGSVMNISTGTSSISGAITISLKYSDDNIPAGTAETDLTMLHYTGGVWKTEDSCTVDTVNNKVTCTVTSLSPFGIGGPGSGASSSSSSSGGGGGSNCDSNGFGTGRSLMVYNVNYSIDTNLVTLQAYSTCGAIFAKITTESGSQVMGLLMEQPLIDENIVMYSATLHESVEDFTINLHNKKNTFDEKYYPHGNDITKSYTGETGYTSAQQGMALPTITSEQTTILPETTIVSEPAVEITPEIIEEINDIKTEKPIIDEKSITPVDQTIAHTSELTSLTCGPGTFEKNGICVMDNDSIKTPQESVSGGLENDFVILIIVLPAVVILAIIILAKRRKKSDS